VRGAMGHDHGDVHAHDHDHEHEHCDNDVGELPPALDVSIPDDELPPSALSRRSLLRAAGVLGAHQGMRSDGGTIRMRRQVAVL
jgi:hypothetical protein